MFVRLTSACTTGPRRRWSGTALRQRPTPTRWSHCCARRCWPAGPGSRPGGAARRRGGAAAARRGRDPGQVRGARRLPATTTCRSCARFYGGQRAAFLRFLAHAAPVSTSQDRATEQAIAFLLAHRTDRRPKLRVGGRTELGADGTAARRPLDLSWVGEKWWPLLTGRTARDPAPAEVDRRYFEICLFTQAVNELKSGDLCIPGSEEYGDYRDQLVSWEEHGRDVAGYAEQAGVPAEPGAFVAALKAQLAATASATDRGLPGERARRDRGRRARGEAAARAARRPTARRSWNGCSRRAWSRSACWRRLADTEHWLGWTRHFGPVSGFDAKAGPPARALPRHRLLLRLRAGSEPGRALAQGPGPPARGLRQPAPRHRGRPRRGDHGRDRRLRPVRPAPALGQRRVRVRRRHEVGRASREPEVQLPHPLRRLRRHRLLPGLGHLHRAVLALPGLRRLGGPLHPRLRGREPVAACSPTPSTPTPRASRRADLRPGAPARHRADAAHPQLAGPAPLPARRGQPLRRTSTAVHRRRSTGS